MSIFGDRPNPIATTRSEYLSPAWDYAGRVHDWRNYASDDLRAIWHTFTGEQKRVLFESLQGMADNEEWD